MRNNKIFIFLKKRFLRKKARQNIGQTTCHIRKVEFIQHDKNHYEVRDHCYHSRKHQGTAYSIYN